MTASNNKKCPPLIQKQYEVDQSAITCISKLDCTEPHFMQILQCATLSTFFFFFKNIDIYIYLYKQHYAGTLQKPCCYSQHHTRHKKKEKKKRKKKGNPLTSFVTDCFKRESNGLEDTTRFKRLYLGYMDLCRVGHRELFLKDNLFKCNIATGFFCPLN